MHVRLKGLNHATKVLADGRKVTYWFAWRGGPRLEGQPGDPDFVANYNAAVATRITSATGFFLSTIEGFLASTDFLDDLAPRTQADYKKHLLVIEKKFGDLPLKAFDDPRLRGVFLGWRDELARKSKRQADYAWTILSRVIAWAVGRTIIKTNPCLKAGRIYSGSRADMVWSDDQEAAFLAGAPAHLHLPLVIGLCTGQRQGDLLRLTWSAYDGRKIRLKQSKTGRRVEIEVGAPLKAMLDATPRLSPTILLNSDGKPWTAEGFSSSWRKACKRARITGVTYNDLRGTAVTRLALAGCTEAEIATITGHSLSDVRSILDEHYLARDPRLAENAIRKLEKRTILQTDTQTVPERSFVEMEKAQ